MRSTRFHGVPDDLWSDQGPLFKSSAARDLLNRLGIRLVTGEPYAKERMGGVERAHRHRWARFEGALFLHGIDGARGAPRTTPRSSGRESLHPAPPPVPFAACTQGLIDAIPASQRTVLDRCVPNRLAPFMPPTSRSHVSESRSLSSFYHARSRAKGLTVEGEFVEVCCAPESNESPVSSWDIELTLGGGVALRMRRVSPWWQNST